MIELGLDVSNSKRQLTRIEISVIAPIYNEAGNIGVLTERIKASLIGITENFEVIFVDDGSKDASANILAKLAKGEPRIRVISLSRNFGHQIAITAGIEHAQGRAVIVIDSDLQDPPELMGEMINKWEEGFDVVYAVRKERKGEGIFKKFTAKAFYRILKKLTRFDMPVDAGDFRLMDRKVVDAFLSMPEQHRYVRGMIAWLGFRQTGIFHDRNARYAGKTKFTVQKMARFALDGITSFSLAPLHLTSLFGCLSVVFSLLMLGYVFWARVYFRQTVPDWSLLAVLTTFLGGIQLLMIGILGEYLGRLLHEQKKRPLYIVQRKINFNIPANRTSEPAVH